MEPGIINNLYNKVLTYGPDIHSLQTSEQLEVVSLIKSLYESMSGNSVSREAVKNTLKLYNINYVLKSVIEVSAMGFTDAGDYAWKRYINRRCGQLFLLDNPVIPIYKPKKEKVIVTRKPNFFQMDFRNKILPSFEEVKVVRLPKNVHKDRRCVGIENKGQIS